MFTCLIFFNGFSQSEEKTIAISFAQDTIENVNTGENISNKLIIKNNTSKEIVLIKFSNDSLALIPLPDTITLAPNEQKIAFTKYFSSPSLLRTIHNHISIGYRIFQTNFSINASFIVMPKNIYNLRLETISNPVYIDAQTNMAHIEIRCINDGYSDLMFKTILKSYPDGLEIVNNNKEIKLLPGAQQIISVNTRNTLSQTLTPDYGLSIQAINPVNNEVLSSSYIQVSMLGSNKRMVIGNDMISSLLNNSMRVGYWHTNIGYDYAQLNLNGNNEVSANGYLKYNFNMNEYTRPTHGTDIYDSRIEYQNKHIGVEAGTITDNLDYSMYGNGIKASAYLDSNTTVNAYYVNNKYYLYSTVNHQLSTGSAWAASYDYRPSYYKSIRINYLHGTDSLTGVHTDFINANANIQLKRKQILSIEGGVSKEHLDSTKYIAKNGASAGIHYRNNGQIWNFVSDNYISSNYYSGIRRGVTLLDERITYQLTARRSVYIHYQLSSNAPGYLDSLYYAYSTKTKSSIYEVGVANSFGRVNINFHPYYFTQGLKENYDYTFLSLYSKSWHAALDVSYNIRQHAFMLNSDVGRTNSNNPYLQHPTYNNWAVRFNYNYKFIGFSANMQYNPYYLIQEPTPWQLGNFRQYSLGPNIYFRGFDNRLDIRASDYLNYYSYAQGYNNSVQAQADYRINRTLSASAFISYNSYQLYQQNRYFQSKISLTKSFMQTNAPGYKKLSIIFYGDENADGVQNEEEHTLSSIIVEVNNSLAESDKKGKVVYTNLKTGNYEVHVQNADGWYVLNPVNILLTHNQRLYIGLVKSAVITGRIVGKVNAYLQQVPNVEGITIIGTDNSGKTYTTLTDVEGIFRIALPVKEFAFSVEIKGHNFTIDGQSQKISVTQQHNPEIIFYLTDLSRKVNIKHF